MTERESITRAHITAANSETLRKVLREHRFPIGGQPRHGQNGEIGIDVYVTPDQLQKLKSLPVKVEILGDETAHAQKLRTEIEDEAKYREPGALPQGLGKLTGGTK